MEVSEAGVWAASLEVAMMVAIRPGRAMDNVISSAEPRTASKCPANWDSDSDGDVTLRLGFVRCCSCGGLLRCDLLRLLISGALRFGVCFWIVVVARSELGVVVPRYNLRH